MPELEKRYKANDIVIPVKDVDSKKGVIKAYFAAFGNQDSDGDIIHPGAFLKSIAERGPNGSNRIKHLKFHDTRMAPGKIIELGEDEFGGYFVSQLSKSTLGRDTLIEYDEGIITEHSHGFQIIKEDQDESGVNNIRESRLWEASTLAAWGANHLTRTESVKGLASEADLIKAFQEITDRLKIGKLSDEYLEQLEKEYATLSGVCDSLIANEEPNANTLKDDKPRLDVIANLLTNGA